MGKVRRSGNKAFNAEAQRSKRSDRKRRRVDIDSMRCMDCWNSCANAAIMWQCLPVPVFGHHKSPIVRVATVGLNPSATEFINDAGDWKPATERLPLVTDFGVQERNRLSEANLTAAANQREKYFQRAHHPFFRSLQGLLSTVNQEWNYVTGTAVHLDLVACGTWRAWGEMSQQTADALIENCNKHLKQKLTELSDGTLLFLDGRTVNTTLAGKFGFGERVEENIGETEVVTVWRGTLQIDGKFFKYIGWSKPVNRLNNCVFLAHAVADTYQLESWCQKGEIYYFGKGVPKNYSEASKWFRMAGERGHASAQCWLGIIYDRGCGMPQDFTEAVKWFQKAALQGNAFSQSQLGSCYQTGRGILQDSTQAAMWYRKAAEQEDVLGQYGLGFCYEHGLGVEIDSVEAIKWYGKAAERGNTDAAEKLTMLSSKVSKGKAA
jgi:hypothetical protein